MKVLDFQKLNRLKKHGSKTRQISCSAHRTPNFTNPEYFVCLLLEYFFQIEFLNSYQNTPKNANTEGPRLTRILGLGKNRVT